MFITECKETQITIIKYIGEDSIVTVPKEIEGYLVTEIGNEAFRGCGFLLDINLPESLKYIGDYAFCECRGLEEIRIPLNVEAVGSHSFYNCRNLKKLNLSSNTKYVGDGFIKNCDEIEEITIDSWKNLASGVVSLLSEFKQKYLLQLKDIDTCLLFPEFDFEYISNAPAKIFKTVTHGAGYKYRLAVESKGIDFNAYDEAFMRAVAEEKADTVICIIKNRLKSGFRLKEEHKNAYIQYLQVHIKEVVSFCNSFKEIWLLEFLKDSQDFTKDAVTAAIEEAVRVGNTELSAYMLDIKLSTFKVFEKSFEL